MSKIWINKNGRLYFKSTFPQSETLENNVYKYSVDENGEEYISLVHEEKFPFDYKIYGLESKLIDRTIKTYKNTKGNLGVLLNGLKGTGKTVTAKMICNLLNLPVILIEKDKCHDFINSITQDVVIFIDEYEKVFDESYEMLSIMDGALNSEFRRVFLLTTNNLYLEPNLLQRPGRIRYLKTFSDLTTEVINEIVEDCLIDKSFKSKILEFISTLEFITVDIVKTIVSEVNIHQEEPESFKEFINVTQNKNTFDIYGKKENGSVLLMQDVALGDMKPSFTNSMVKNWFIINDEYIGKISKVLSQNIIELNIDKNLSEEYSWTQDYSIIKVIPRISYHGQYNALTF